MTLEPRRPVFGSEPAGDAAIRIRGSALIPLRPFVDRYFGNTGAEQLRERLGSESNTAAVVFGQVMASTWYPFHVALDTADALLAIAGHSRVLRDFAKYNLDYAAGAIFKAIFKIGTPEFMVARADQVWRKFYSHGRMTCEATRGHATVKLHGFPWLRPNYDILVQHSVEAALLKAGARNCVTRHSQCVLRSDPVCETHYDWER